MVTGIIFPLSIANGNLAVASEGELFKGHILSWLQTQPKERVMRPAYGMDDYLFDSIPDISAVTSNIKAGLQNYIPEVEFDVQGLINDAGEVLVYVYWTYQDNESVLKITL